jgi:hypothetical protein
MITLTIRGSDGAINLTMTPPEANRLITAFNGLPIAMWRHLYIEVRPCL